MSEKITSVVNSFAESRVNFRHSDPIMCESMVYDAVKAFPEYELVSVWLWVDEQGGGDYPHIYVRGDTVEIVTAVVAVVESTIKEWKGIIIAQ